MNYHARRRSLVKMLEQATKPLGLPRGDHAADCRCGLCDRFTPEEIEAAKDDPSFAFGPKAEEKKR